MAPENLKILGVISKEDRADEVQRRLREEENMKARKLLAMASSHRDAFFIQKSIIEQQLEKLNQDGKSKK